MNQPPHDLELTHLLHQWQEGNDEALNEVFFQVYEDLYKLANYQTQKHAKHNNLDNTVLVHEAYIRLVEGKRIHFENRQHFFALISIMMCRILIENARKRQSLKRGGSLLTALKEECAWVRLPNNLEPETLLSLETAKKHLERTVPRAARVMELKIFGELENKEVASILSISLATVKREWALAKKQMFLYLSGN